MREVFRWLMSRGSRRNGDPATLERWVRLRAFWLKRIKVISLVRHHAVYVSFAVTHHALPA